VITGADILGRLFRGIATRQESTAVSQAGAGVAGASPPAAQGEL
jgi:hypothetical protein